MADRLLEVRDLQTSFRMRDGVVRAVDGATFGVDRGEVLGLVGESGCGKSVTSLSILRLIAPPGQITGGSVRFDGQELLTATELEMQKIRGNRIAMIFQQPNSSLNPVQKLADQIGEVLRIHKGLDEKAARMRGIELLELVGIPDPSRRADAYPHEISGGMAQRVMIAMALACEPELLIADEPTTALSGAGPSILVFHERGHEDVCELVRGVFQAHGHSSEIVCKGIAHYGYKLDPVTL